MRRQNGRTILIGRQSEKFIQSDRYSILHKEGVNDLTIYNVTENDIGEYICQINTEPMKNYLFILNIMRSPEITESYGLATVEEGQKVDLSCKAIGNPSPKIKWKRRDGRKMNFLSRSGEIRSRKVFGGDHLTLVDVRKNDTGEVLCIADNGYPPQVSQKFELTIHYKPRIQLHLDEFRRSYEGFVKLMCRIDSVPLPQHAEMRIAGRLLDTWQKVISDRIVELHFERSTDFGQDVECNAENTAGADSKRERIPYVEIETTPPRREEEDTSTLTSTTQNFLIYNDNSGSTTLEERNFYHQIPSSNNEKSTFAWSKSPKFEIESLPVILLIVASLRILF